MDSFTLPNGIRIIHELTSSDVAYCGLMMNTGSRDETEAEQGMAHFIEHTVFKGTEHRSSNQIINRLENIGGELNAYTTKEETVVYAAFLSKYFSRAMELISDMVFHSTFPQAEIDKELVVILDEIESYNDSPSELIYDDFESVLYGSHSFGHAILGEAKTIKKIKTANALKFIRQKYNTDEMVFFSQGNISFKQIMRWAEKYLGNIPCNERNFLRTAPTEYTAKRAQYKKETHQTHYMCGNIAYDLHHNKRLGLYLLNNILGGSGMNSLLNLSLRERNGLVYNVESSYTPFSDTGYWSVYFGCDTENRHKCENLVYKELRKLREQKIADATLHKYKLQLCGQMAISAENQENNVLSMAKSYLHFNKATPWQTTFAKIEKITATELQDIANEIFDDKNISVLTYE